MIEENVKSLINIEIIYKIENVHIIESHESF